MKIRAYTDGACSSNPGPGGWAGIIYLNEEIKEIGGKEAYTTNNRMELLAAVKVLKYLNHYGHNNSKIEIHSDSAYVVNSIKLGHLKKWKNNGWKTVKGGETKNKDLWLLILHYLREFKEVNFVKVKGHSGNYANERVDKLAKSQVEIAQEEAKG